MFWRSDIKSLSWCSTQKWNLGKSQTHFNMSSSLKSGIGFTERFQDRSKIMHCNASELPELTVLQKYTRLHHWRIPEKRKVKPGWYVYWQNEGFYTCYVFNRGTVLGLLEGVVLSIDKGTLNEPWYWRLCVHEEVHSSLPVWGSGAKYWYRNTEWVLVLMDVCSRGGPRFSACRREWSQVLIQGY